MLKAPFPYFGAKSRIAGLVWARFGDVPCYVEPFAGSLAVLLSRPTPSLLETVNDADGFISNFWRAVQKDPAGVAKAANWPVNENDLHARHGRLNSIRTPLTIKLEGDPDYYDTDAAGWWVWGISQWIGSGWCSGQGPWVQIDGQLVDSREIESSDSSGFKRQLPHLKGGKGINRQLPHLSGGKGINRQIPHLNVNQGINRRAIGGVAERLEQLTILMSELSDRLINVRVCCGDWTRVCGPSVTYYNGLTGVFLDPPYSDDEHCAAYALGKTTVARDVRDWAVSYSDNPDLRIALCGYEGEHTMPDSWDCVEWKTVGGYGSQGDGRGRDNAGRERIWFSPNCLPAVQEQLDLFSSEEE